MKEFIKTTFKEKKDAPVREQWFLATIPQEWHDIAHQYMSCIGTVEATMAVKYLTKTLPQISLYNIKFTPVTEVSDNCKSDRRFHRGWDSDENPIMYRGQCIPEFKMGFYKDHAGEIIPTVDGHDINGKPGMRSQLKLWFKDQLQAALTQELLTYLKEQERERYLKAARQKVKELRDSLDKFEERLETL